jgi:hypothetical protein
MEKPADSIVSPRLQKTLIIFDKFGHFAAAKKLLFGK